MVRRALLIGINYFGTSAELNGCHNDITLKALPLLHQLGFKKEDCVIMLDSRDGNQGALEPTHDHILAQMKAIVAKCERGDMLYVHYSGHGSWTYDRRVKGKKGDERDGRDETIYPVDGREIVDDTLFATLVKPLARGVTLRVIFDCCHSGSALDLPYRYVKSGKTYRENRNRVYNDVVMISGCRDKQTSADAYINDTYQGALTWAFTETMKEVLKSPFDMKTWIWKDLLTTMRHKLRVDGYDQVPQLSVGDPKQLRDAVQF